MLSTQSQTCINGHVSPADARFCNACGQPLSAQHKDGIQLNEMGGDDVEIADSKSMTPQMITEPVAAQPVPVQPVPVQPVPVHAVARKVTAASNSAHCSGCGHRFAKGQFVCEGCQTIKPLAFDHYVHPELFQWSLDGQAMAKLRAIKPLVAVANQVSRQVGRPWIEANFNGVRLSARQMPNVYAMAVQAARILGLQRMPGVYVSGARPWDAMTFGSNDDSFIVIGSALVSCFEKSDLMFLFAREMGHILAGHALWKTVIQFCVGEQRGSTAMMRNGVAGLLDPFKLLESAVELPLVAWARQAEITADRAGLLASGGLHQARRTLMMWSLRSPMLYRQINIQAWLEQQEEDTGNNNVRLAEAVTSSTPYLTRRLKLMQEYESTAAVYQFRRKIMSAYKAQKAEAVKATAALEKKTTEQESGNPQNSKAINFVCPKCESKIFLSKDNLAGKTAVAVKCPNSECQNVSRLSISGSKKQTDEKPSNSQSPDEVNEALSQMGG